MRGVRMLPPGLLRLLQISGRRGLGWVRSAAAADVDAIADNVAVAQRRAAAPAALLDSVADNSVAADRRVAAAAAPADAVADHTAAGQRRAAAPALPLSGPLPQ